MKFCVYFFLFYASLLSACKPEKQPLAQQENIVSQDTSPRFQYSLAQWSLHRALQSQKLDPMDFAEKAKEFGFTGVEYVSTFYKGKSQDTIYLAALKQKAEDQGIQSVLIMVDGEGDLGVMDETTRNQAVENHYKWVDAAAFLGCHSIRVNLNGTGTETEIADAGVLALKKLSVYAKKKNINIIVENHGGNSSHGVWLKSVISRANMPNCGTLPDFGNFCIEKDGNGKCTREYDRYKGVWELMPYAKGVSAKSYDFDENGEESTINYLNMYEIIQKTDYKGFIGIEYEGDRLSEDEGIRATMALVKKYFGT